MSVLHVLWVYNYMYRTYVSMYQGMYHEFTYSSTAVLKVKCAWVLSAWMIGCTFENVYVHLSLVERKQDIMRELDIVFLRKRKYSTGTYCVSQKKRNITRQTAILHVAFLLTYTVHCVSLRLWQLQEIPTRKIFSDGRERERERESREE